MNAGQSVLPLSGITVVSLEQAIAAPGSRSKSEIEIASNISYYSMLLRTVPGRNELARHAGASRWRVLDRWKPSP